MSRSRIEAAPIEEGVVAALNHDGEGVVRGTKTVFVPGVLPGETIRFQRQRRHRQHDEAVLVEVVTPSADRVEPKCAHFGVCGGCSLQHYAPEAQLAAKQQELMDNLQRIAKVTPDSWLAPIEGSVWRYRRRARLGAKFVTKRGRVLVGFRERAKPYIAALERCEILAAPLDGLITPLSDLLSGMAAKDTIPQIEAAVTPEKTVLVFRHLAALSESDLAALREFEATQGVRIYLQSGGVESIVPLVGAATPLRYSLSNEGLIFEFEPTDFVQINAAVNETLVTRAIDLLQVGPEDRVLDLFCGLGNFTLALARKAASVVGVEGDAGLVARARRNAELNGIANASFQVANLFDSEAGQSAFQGQYTRVLLDPPRAGALEALPRVAATGAPRIVYVSCHPGTLARDVGVLCHDLGYRLQSAGVIDMFPHTNHVESMAVLERAR